MDFYSKITELQNMIYQFMQVHNNPHDTSKHNEVAKQLTVLEPTLNKVPKKNSTGSITASVGNKGINKPHDVQLVQELLGIEVDGIYGKQTLLAICEFQRNLGFRRIDGLIEPNKITWKNLIANTSSTRKKGIEVIKPDATTEKTPQSSKTSTKTSTTIQQSVGLGGINNPEDVSTIQNILKNTWGYNIPVNGKIDDKTIQAIRKFQYRFAGNINSQDSKIDVGGKTFKYLVGTLKPTMKKTDDGIIGKADTPLEKKMAEFTKAFTGIQIEVNPGEFVSVRPPYHINLGKRLKKVTKARNANKAVKRIILGLGFGGGVGKATPAQITTFLEKCIGKNLIKNKTSQGLHEFLSTYGVSTDCSGLAVQAANFLLDGDMKRPKLGQHGEKVKITNTKGIQQHPKVASPKQLRAGDMMVNYKRKGTKTYHVRVIIDVDINDDGSIQFTTVESGSSSNLGDGGDGVGQRRWAFPDGTKFENVQILKGNNWQRGNASDQAYTYVRMRQLTKLSD